MPALPFHQRRGVRQLVKFALVGASSTVITFIVLNLMLTLLHGHRYISAGVAFLVSVGNGYFWNKRWTFKEAAAKATHTQFAQFLLVNLVGLALTTLIIRLVSVPLEQHLVGVPADKTERVATNIAQLIATGIVVFWNFFANRLWTFKH